MKDILKMLQFDYITVKSLTVRYVIGFIMLSFLLALFKIPLGMLCMIATVTLFAPVQTISNSECKKLYGMIPIQRSAVTRAMFLELIGSLVTGELFSYLFLQISKYAKLDALFPEEIRYWISDMFDYSSKYANITYNDLYLLLAVVSGFLILLSCYIEMRAEVKNMETAVRDLIIIIFVLSAVISLISVFVFRGMIPPVKSWLIPATVSGRWLSVMLLNLIAIGGGLGFCEWTVKKTADYEM